jgi:hypothetical protein
MPLDPFTGSALYNIGDKLRLQATFTDLSDVVADPTAVVLKVKNSAGTVTTYNYPGTITRASAGVYYYDFSVTVSGTHYFNWAGTGAYTAADESSFTVVTTVFV